jgi:hypothetical protein
MRMALVCTVALLLVACGGGGSGTPSQATTASQPSASQTVRGPADLITEAEINANARYDNALEVIQNLRPQMLRPRTGAGTQPIRLYIDDVQMNDMNGLATMPPHRIKEIRYLNPRDATTRWGTGHAGGVIVVTTKR